MNIFNNTNAIICMVFLLLAGISGADPASKPAPLPPPGVPAAEPIARYQPILDRSPFALATQSAPTPPPAEAPSFARDFVLVAAARFENGNYFISISSRSDPNQRFSLGRGDTYNGINVANVAWSDAVGKTKVTLKRGEEYGVIGFDEALLRTATTGAPPGAGTPGTPGGAPQPLAQQMGVPAGVVIPNNPTPDSTANPAAPATPDASSNPPVVTPPAAPATSGQPLLRRRIIRSAPAN